MGPRAVQEFQVKLPRFGDFYFFALKKRLSLKLNISMKIKDNQLLIYIFSKLFKFSFLLFPLFKALMLIYGCKTGSKLGNFSKISNLFNQNRRGQGVVKIRDKQFFT